MFITSFVNTDLKKIFTNITFYIRNCVCIYIYIFYEAYFKCNYLYVLHTSMI